jgi:hypothetical protein
LANIFKYLIQLGLVLVSFLIVMGFLTQAVALLKYFALIVFFGFMLLLIFFIIELPLLFMLRDLDIIFCTTIIYFYFKSISYQFVIYFF